MTSFISAEQAFKATTLSGTSKSFASPPLRTVTAATTILSPDEVYQLCATTAKQKDEAPLPKLLPLGILAGAYIGLGYALCCLCGGLLPPEFRKTYAGVFNFFFAIFGFPMGLTLVVVAGADLFTSNCAFVVIGMAEGKFGLLRSLRTLFVSYFSNLLGCLMLVGLMSAGEVFTNRSDFVVELALQKVARSWAVVFAKGILCNWLVCLSVWQGNMARDFTGKAVGIFLPLTAFVAMGFEHCVANMWLVSMSMALGSGISVGTFVGRLLIPVTLGNIVGGSFFVDCMYAIALGSPGKVVQDAWEDKVVSKSWAFAMACGAAGRHSQAHLQKEVSDMEAGTKALSRRQPAADEDDSARGGPKVTGASSTTVPIIGGARPDSGRF